MSSDEQQIRKLHSTWLSAVNAGDLACLLTWMAEDVVFLAPGQAPFGRDGFSANLSEALQRIQFHCTSELEEVVLVGEVAYTRCRDTLLVTPLAGGTTTRFGGYRITVYRKQSDGRWLLARDAHTLCPIEEGRS